MLDVVMLLISFGIRNSSRVGWLERMMRTKYFVVSHSLKLTSSLANALIALIVAQNREILSFRSLLQHEQKA
jgi:hypothetical protein